MTKDRCYWHRDPEIGRVFIPGCIGGGVSGPDGCTCPDVAPTYRTMLKRKIAQIEADLAETRARLATVEANPRLARMRVPPE